MQQLRRQLRCIAAAVHAASQLQLQLQLQQRAWLHLAPPFLVEDYVPAAVTTYRLGRMPAKVAAAQAELAACRACPRDCGVDRLADQQTGVCKVGRHALVSTVAPHHAEESVIRGWRGSGTVFMAMCNLKCVFCQNWDISQSRSGFELTADSLADWMLKLQEHGCHNINVVTPEHVAPQVAEAIAAAVAKGLSLPIIYNTSAYDSLSSLALMDGLVDIYLPDFKFWSPESAHRYAKARDYPQHARLAIKEMHRQVGDLVFSPDGLAQRGVLLRHLVMPGLVDEGRAILEWVASELGRDTFVHIMQQYVPRFLVGQGEVRAREGRVDYKELDRRPRDDEVAALLEHARALGLWRFEEQAQWESGELAG